MNELVSAPISPWYTIPVSVGLLALTFVFAPGVLLHFGVMFYPKGHDRRQEFTAELYTVPYIKRPFWVAGVLVRCVFEGTTARRAVRRPGGSKGRTSRPKKLLLLGAGITQIFATISFAMNGEPRSWLMIIGALFIAVLVIWGVSTIIRDTDEEKDS